MAQLNIRLDDDRRDQLDALAHARGVTTSDLVRHLIGQALGYDDPSGRKSDLTPPSLSAVDRRRLALQHETMQKLSSINGEDGDWESQYHQRMVEVLNSGYTAEYYRTFQMIQPEMTDRDCNLVHDILEMFTQLEWSVGSLSVEERASLGEYAGHAFTFRGFDFNDSYEGRLASYAAFVVAGDRWESMAKYFDLEHSRGNSHMPRLASYQRMLVVFRPLWQKKVEEMGGPNDYRLTAEELRIVAAAWPYPKA